MLKLFVINEDEILSKELIIPDNLILVNNEDSKTLYVYRGKYAPNLDQFRSNLLYERIINRFLNPNVLIIKSLLITEKDSFELKTVKQFILDHFPNLGRYEFKRLFRKYVLLQDLRVSLKNFRNYQSSREWRSKISNLTNIWRLSAFNILIMMAVGVILTIKTIYDFNGNDYIFLGQDGKLDSTLWQLWLQNLTITMVLCITFLVFSLIINFLFIIFPMKFPINPHAIDSLSISKPTLAEVKEKVLAPAIKSPILPPTSQQTGGKMTAPLMKISIPAKTAVPAKAGNIGEEFEDDDLDIPATPIRKAVSLKASDLSLDIPNLDEIAKKDTPETKHIVVEDLFVNKNVIVPVPRKLLSTAKNPIVEISFVVNNPPHVLAIQVDHDFQVRRCRASPVIFEVKK